MPTITRRQNEILRHIFDSGSLHVRGIADRLGSPNRLRADLEALVESHLLHMKREGKEHHYSVTKTGFKHIANQKERIIEELKTAQLIVEQGRGPPNRHISIELSTNEAGAPSYSVHGGWHMTQEQRMQAYERLRLIHETRQK